MKEKRYGTLQGLTVPVQVYSSFEEVAKVISPDKAIDILNDNLHYRSGPAIDTRDFICELIAEKQTKLPREAKPVLVDGKPKTKTVNGKEVPVMEFTLSEGEYARKVVAANGWEDLSQFQADVDAWARKAYDGKPLAVDATAPEPKAKKDPVPDADDIALANKLLDGKADIKKFLQHSAKFGGVAEFKPTGDREADVKTLALAAKAYFKAKAAADKKAGAF